MKTYTTEEIKVVLAKHSAWLRNEPEGERAYLSRAYLLSADLHCADLQGANLSGANLRGADLTGANLRGASLNGADLSDANLYVANLSSADLSRAYLLSADLHCAYLRGAYLRGAYLRGANLYDTNLRDANLSGADLRGANLRGANLYDTNLRDATLGERFMRSRQIVCEGDLVVWKKLQGNTLAKLKIPAEAKRVGGLTGRKCRAEYAEVLEVIGPVNRSIHNPEFAYVVGETVRPDKFDPDPRVECAPGIHFFLTREEAEDYGS